MNEVWKQSRLVPCWMVSSHGRVSYKGEIKAVQMHQGYEVVTHGRSECKRFKRYLVHRLVANEFIGDVEGRIVDHIDRDTRNNVVSNLRYVNNSQSARNRKHRCDARWSRYVGVIQQNVGKQQYKAGVRVDGKRLYRCGFGCETAAAIARDKLAKELHGTDTAFNFPELFGGPHPPSRHAGSFRG